MRRLFMILPFVLFICLAVISQVKEAETSSTEDLEKELRKTLARGRIARKEHDLDTMYKISGDAIGFGYRSQAPRLHDEKSFRAGNKRFWDSMESFETIANEEDFVIHIIGNVGVILGTFTEKFKPKGGELQTIKVRYSTTYAKIDGKWKQVQYHRDVQKAAIAKLEELRAQAEAKEQHVEQTKLEVEKVFKELQKAILESDIETLERLYADDYILTTRNGNTATKYMRIAGMKSGEQDYLEIQTTGEEIRILGETAVITGQMAGKVKHQDREIDQPPRRFTCVFAKNNGYWQMLAIHISDIEQ